MTVESLSEPNVLTPTMPPLRSAAVFTPGAAKNVKRMTLTASRQAQVAAGAVDPHHRRQPDMHDVDAAGLQFLGAAAAAVHVENIDVEALRGIEARRRCAMYQASTVFTGSEMPALMQDRLRRLVAPMPAAAPQQRENGKARKLRLVCIAFCTSAVLVNHGESEFAEQPAEALDAVFDAAAAQCIPDDRLMRASCS